MESSVEVRSIEALSKLKEALARYRQDAPGSLRSLLQEADRTQHYLAERKRHWQFEIRRCGEEVRQAQTALARCRASARSDPHTGRQYIPDCSAQEAALRRVVARLTEAEDQLRRVTHAIRQVEDAVASFRRQSDRLSYFLGDDLLKAEAFLENKIAALHAYTLTRLQAPDRSDITERSSASTYAFEDGAGMGRKGLATIAAQVVRRFSRDLQRSLGPRGKELLDRLPGLDENWHEHIPKVPQDDFGSVFSEPDQRLLVAETKSSDFGQGFPESVAGTQQDFSQYLAEYDRPVDFSDPAQQEQISDSLVRLIDSLDLGERPLAVVIVEPDTRQSSVFCRAPDAETWQLLHGGLPLDQALEMDEYRRRDEAQAWSEIEEDDR